MKVLQLEQGVVAYGIIIMLPESLYAVTDVACRKLDSAGASVLLER